MAEQNYVDALKKAQEEFGQGDPLLMADCSGAVYEQLDNAAGFFTVRYLNKDYRIDFPSGQVSFLGTDFAPNSNEVEQCKVDYRSSGCARPIPQVKIDYSGNTILVSDKTLMLQYLTRASGLPPREQWINFIQLPEGAHHHGPFIVDAVNPMVEFYHDKKELFLEKVQEMGGRSAQLGDLGAVIPVLPKIEMAVMIWEGDEEFLPKGSILFDSNISTYLDTAGVYVLGINMARRLVTIGHSI